MSDHLTLLVDLVETLDEMLDTDDDVTQIDHRDAGVDGGRERDQGEQGKGQESGEGSVHGLASKTVGRAERSTASGWGSRRAGEGGEVGWTHRKSAGLRDRRGRGLGGRL